jgi:predicted O-methyltransferase YrrM
MDQMDFAMKVQQAVEEFHANMPLVRPVDQLIERTVLGDDNELSAALAASRAARLVPFEVARNQGKLLEILLRGAGAARALEIGTLGGYSTICLARGVGAGGRVLSIERDPRHAEVAARNLEDAGVADRVQVRVGVALDVLKTLAAEGVPRFDFAFIDADKENDVEYVRWAIRLCRPGALIFVDNVVRFGGVLDPDAAQALGDSGARGSRNLMDFVTSCTQLDGTAVQTVGDKGWDGFALLIVNPSD